MSLGRCPFLSFSVGFVLRLLLDKSGKPCMEYFWSLDAVVACVKVETINTSACLLVTFLEKLKAKSLRSEPYKLPYEKNKKDETLVENAYKVLFFLLYCL